MEKHANTQIHQHLEAISFGVYILKGYRASYTYGSVFSIFICNF